MAYLITEGQIYHPFPCYNLVLTTLRVGGQPTKMGSRTYSFNYVDGKADENAFAIFEFKYRSLGKIFKYLTVSSLTDFHLTAMLKALRVIPDDSKVTPQPQPTRVEHSRATPAIEKTIPMGVNHSHSSGLSNAELIAIIGTYREHTSGLSGLNGKELAAVLEYYRVCPLRSPNIAY